MIREKFIPFQDGSNILHVYSYITKILKMKKLFLWAVATMLLAACQPDDITLEQSVEGSWELVKIYTWSEVKEGEEMGLRETYNFKSDGTFTKIRFGAEINDQGSGTFSVSEREIGDFTIKSLHLIFEENVNSELLYYYCEEPLTEYLFIQDGSLINWGYGPECPIADTSSLVYNK